VCHPSWQGSIQPYVVSSGSGQKEEEEEEREFSLDLGVLVATRLVKRWAQNG